jgi:hypothetical protein
MSPDTALTLFELRCYRTRPGRRDDLIQMFEAHFCPAYEAGGATILASWTVPEDPDLWVWIRAFANGRERRQALESFYGGEVWGRLASDCRATLADSATSYLLRGEQASELGRPPQREVLPLHLRRPWVAAVDRAEAAPWLDWAEERTLRLTSRQNRVWLCRADAGADAEGEVDDVLGMRGPPQGRALKGLRHLWHLWHLDPTPCSRLR